MNNSESLDPIICTGVMSPMTASNMRIGGDSKTVGVGQAVTVLQIELPALEMGLVPPKLLSESPIVCASETHDQALASARWLVNNLDKIPHATGWDNILAMAYTIIETLGGGIK